jgi:UDP-glucose 4,6-dehydratase
VYDNVNAISHRGDFVRACLDLWERRAPWGIYNVTNPGFVTTKRVVELVQEILCPDRVFEFWKSDEEFYRVAAKVPRSNCVLDVTKLLAAGIKIRPVQEAIAASLHEWKPETETVVNSPA